MVLVAPECTFRVCRCIFGFDLSTKESVVVLPVSSVPLDPMCVWLGEFELCFTLEEPGFTIFWACFLVDLLALQR
jgi:hypothetical protein